MKGQTILMSEQRKMDAFNIDDLKPIDHVSKSYIPALFVHAKDDKFILPHHSKDLYKITESVVDNSEWLAIAIISSI